MNYSGGGGGLQTWWLVEPLIGEKLYSHTDLGIKRENLDLNNVQKPTI